MGFLIDGFNLIYKFPKLEGMMYVSKLNEARAGLLGILKEYQQVKPGSIRIVFDGKRDHGDSLRSEKIGSLEIFYSHDLSADHLIKQFIKADPNPRMTTVITSDKDIAVYVNRFRAPVIKSEDFATQIQDAIVRQNAVKRPEKDADPKLSDDELLYWEELFKNRKNLT
jgi:predicted RNA-binding protein with PIN domain